ncbi:MAG: hypothetical protein ACR2OE_10465 [Thermomicrobiales bacterium]
MHPNLDLLTLLVAERQQQIRADAANTRTSHPIGFTRRLTGQALIAIGERIGGASRRDAGSAHSPFDQVLSSALHTAK